MRIKLTSEQETQLRAFLDAHEDAEQLSAREYVADLYDLERPITLNLVFVKGGIGVDGAAELKYDEGENGWYMGERIERPEEVLEALKQAGAITL